MKSAKDRMDIISAYQQLGSYRAAAGQCGTTHRTVKRHVDKFEADQAGAPTQPRDMRGLGVTSGDWSPTRKRCGVVTIIRAAARLCGRRVSIW